MSKFADVLQEIWGDPWFLTLGSEAKTLYLWGISNPHSHVGGLYVVARPIIEMETGLKAKKLDSALAAVFPSLKYDEPTGAVWVRGRARRTHYKTKQVAVSIATSVLSFPHLPFVAEFFERYDDVPWMVQDDTAQAKFAEAKARLNEPYVSLTDSPVLEPNGVRLTRALPKAPIQIQRQAVVVEEPLTTVAPARAPELPEGLSGYLVPVADTLRRVAAAKPGALEVKDEAVAKSLRDFAAKDLVPLAADFEHYWVHGAGGPKPVKDVVATWRNRLRTQPDVSRKTPPSGGAAAAGGPEPGSPEWVEAMREQQRRTIEKAQR